MTLDSSVDKRMIIVLLANGNEFQVESGSIHELDFTY
jgi:hypothetical protein